MNRHARRKATAIRRKQLRRENREAQLQNKRKESGRTTHRSASRALANLSKYSKRLIRLSSRGARRRTIIRLVNRIDAMELKIFNKLHLKNNSNNNESTETETTNG